MYLLTACADFGHIFLEDAKRLFLDATQRKMYITGGFGSEPQVYYPIPLNSIFLNYAGLADILLSE